MTPSHLRSSRFFLIRSLVLFLFVLLGVRLVYVQGILKTELSDRANRQIPKLKNQWNHRLSILDRHSLPLAETVPVYSCFLDPTQIRNPQKVAGILSSVLDVDKNKWERKIQRCTGSFLWVKRNVPPPLVANLRSMGIKGLGFKVEYRRHYPMGLMASHVLGMVGIDGDGLSGIEQKYNASLNSQKKSKLPKGQVRLTIDGWIQQIAERELDWGARKTKAKRGMVVIQDPWTGEILALASWPPLSLDPDSPPSSLDLRIPAVTDVFEPGSTFKIVAAAAALEEKLVSREERFDGEK